MKKLFSFLALVLTVSIAAFASDNGLDRRTVAVVLIEMDDDDKQTITTVFTTLTAAEKIAKALDVELIASDEAINDDMFVFAVKSGDQKALIMRVFDEEGAEVAANGVQITEGLNGRTLNVNTLNDGTYTFKLMGENNTEVSREIVIDRGRVSNR